MKASETKVRMLLEGQKQFMVPLFQRPYSWDQKNWASLWNDVLETYVAGPKKPHFLGSMVTKSLPGTAEGVSPFLVVDGQQRLTTITIMLIALRDNVKNDFPGLAKKINDLYLSNTYASGNDIYKILPTQLDRKEYFSVLNLENGPFNVEGTSQFTKAYKFFYKKISNLQEELASLDHHEHGDIKLLEQVMVSDLELVNITLSESDNEYRIFESLNAKGAPLSQADLIRNYIFMRIPHEKQEEMYGKLWTPMQRSLGGALVDYFRYQVMSEGQFVRESDIYSEWKRRFEGLNVDGLLSELQRLVEDSEYYKRLISPDAEPQTKIATMTRRLNRWRGQTIYPFLLNVYRDYAAGSVTTESFVTILSILESFLVRRFFVGITTNPLNRLFLRLYQQIDNKDDLVAGTKHVLSEQSRRWPSDSEFTRAIQQFPLYINGTPDQRRLVLETLETNYGHKEQVALADLSIEHIMPQTLTDEWRQVLGEDADKLHEQYKHRMGNLTLTAYNSELSNSPFETKRELLQNSNLEMNKEIANLSQWGIQEIEDRGARLAECAVQIWPGPIRW